MPKNTTVLTATLSHRGLARLLMQEFFPGLPEPSVFVVRRQRCSYFTPPRRIVLAYDDDEEQLRGDLIHELTHYWLWHNLGWKRCGHTMSFWYKCGAVLRAVGLRYDRKRKVYVPC